MQAEPEAQFQEFVRGRWSAGVDERGALVGALAQLPPKQRAVVVMRYSEDLSEAEVADVLGCSVGTVKNYQRTLP